ncbi:MAG: septum formation initiator family protein [Bacteroidales bacterium]|nr:septum formation initiator family protein [Bacteroidales bacterium]
MFSSLVVAAGIWLAFLSEHSLVSILKLEREKNRMQQEIVSFKDSISHFERSIEEVSGQSDEMEHFAREKLLMKAPDEDVFLIDE